MIVFCFDRIHRHQDGRWTYFLTKDHEGEKPRVREAETERVYPFPYGQLFYTGSALTKKLLLAKIEGDTE